ncbi:hypothetical protein ACH42_04565 [Endozoicomonas sp. (ex Bugula neritina AB1)]|nr:hypothetical protein ACH42_04565 [Endozoicomonas sp. (ex Bugula neritina AB1)]
MVQLRCNGYVLIKRATLFLLMLFILIAYVPAKADENASVLADFSTTQTTPGQLITITLRIFYDDGVDMVFRPKQQHWNKIQLLEYSQAVPVWQDNQWTTSFTLKVSAPVVGEYQFPELRVDFYRDADHWQVSSVSMPLLVVSAFPQGDLKLQGFESLPGVPSVTEYLLWVLALPFTLILLGLWFLREQTPALSLSEYTTAEDLARQAEETGYMDWEGLRQWLVITTGSDPLGQLTTTEPLLHEYQALRFDASSNVQSFIDLCRRCQEHWA